MKIYKQHALIIHNTAQLITIQEVDHVWVPNGLTLLR